MPPAAALRDDRSDDDAHVLDGGGSAPQLQGLVLGVRALRAKLDGAGTLAVIPPDQDLALDARHHDIPFAGLEIAHHGDDGFWRVASQIQAVVRDPEEEVGPRLEQFDERIKVVDTRGLLLRA